jgi:hypothetical protein
MGHLIPGLDSDLLQLYLFGFAAIPFLVPQVTELITGHGPTNSAFTKNVTLTFFVSWAPS